MHNLKENFDRAFPIIQTLLENDVNEAGNVPKPGPKPKFSDLEIITLSLIADSLLIDSENYLFKKLHSESVFSHLIERSVYNRRKRSLSPLIYKVRNALVEKLVSYEDTFVLDSMPVEICKFARAKRIKICKEHEQTSPEFGYCAAQQQTYYGYKLHGVCTMKGVITDFDLSKGNMSDIHYLNDIRDQYHDCTLLGDKGYLSNELQTELFEKNRLLLETPMRSNQRRFKNSRRFLGKYENALKQSFLSYVISS